MTEYIIEAEDLDDVVEGRFTISGKRKKGKWDDKRVAFYFKCSECGCCVRAFAGEVFLDYAQEWNFCPNCGADMRCPQTDDN